jgi:DNA-binding NarL/FixJ family response regulator
VKPIRILVADDHTLVLAGIRALLEEIEGVSIVGEAHNGRDAVAMAISERPDLVVMDISMKELNVSGKTVETHRAALMERLGIRDVAGLVLYAVRNHLVSVDGAEE